MWYVSVYSIKGISDESGIIGLLILARTISLGVKSFESLIYISFKSNETHLKFNNTLLIDISPQFANLLQLLSYPRLKIPHTLQQKTYNDNHSIRRSGNRYPYGRICCHIFDIP